MPLMDQTHKLHLAFNVMNHFVRDRAVFCLPMTLKCVSVAVVHLEAADSTELNGDHYCPPG